MESKIAKHIPMRMCAACRSMKQKDSLIRVVAENGALVIDERQKKQGRGTYLCKSAECILTAQKKRALSRLLKKQVSDEFYKELTGYAQR